MAKKKSVVEEVEEVDFNELRKSIRLKLIKKYGSIPNFLASPKGKELGGMRIRPYLYETGPVNYNITSKLCTFLNFGKLTRNLHVVRTFTYKLIYTPTDK